MKFCKAIRRLALLCLSILGLKAAFAQEWNPGHAVGTIDAKYHFSYSEVPSQLVEIYPAATPNTGLSYQWEMSSSPVFSGTPAVVGTQSSYSFSSALSETKYYRRKTIYTANGSFIYSNILKIAVVSQNWEDRNYIREHDVLVSGVTNWQNVDQLPIGSKLQTTTYLDGLGRSIEKVTRETATPTQPNGSWGDMVQFSRFDLFGRQQESYLPYTTLSEPGKFKTDAMLPQPSEQVQYYANRYSETSAKTVLTFDNSPLSRVLNIKEPGGAWAASTGKSVSYSMNDAEENVQLFSTGYTQTAAPVTKGPYDANTLYKVCYTDENNNRVIEYTDNLGRLILKKVQLDENPTVAHAGWICTYFIYDDFGRFRYQLQPEAVNFLDNNGWSFGTAAGQQVLDEWCFQYCYDDKGRVTWKKAPGAKPLRMLYDIRDRLVFTQDGNQAALSPAEWTAVLYDDLDRPVITTLYHTSKTVEQLQADIDNAVISSTITVANPAQPINNLVVDSRDPGISRYAATNSIEFISNGSSGFETGTGDEFIAEIDPAAVTSGYTVATTTLQDPISSVELNDPAVCTILKYQFYDDYGFSASKPFDNNFDNASAYSPSDPDVQPIVTTERTLGFPTGGMTRVLGTDQFLVSTSYYDEKGRPVQNIQDNIKSGKDVSTIQYHFDGRLLSSQTKHTTAGTGYSNYSILTKYLFDKIGRVTGIQKKFGDNNLKTISSYDYDDAGRVKTKYLDPDYNSGTGLESLVYSFNIHNQITGINKDYALKAPGSYDKWGHFFGMYLGFDNVDGVFAKPELNGHVTGLLWSTQGDAVQRKYDYTYDNAGRLVKADFNEKEHADDTWANNKMDFSVSGYTGKISYDLNGNLVSMLQKGVMPGATAPITVDDLRYSYSSATLSYSNKLQSVTDMVGGASTNGLFGDFKDGTNGANPDYVYDDNGNVVVDLNKNAKDLDNVAGANGIHYNFLDKPDRIRIAGKGTISIVYSADGEKLQRVFTPESGTATTTTFINQFVYHSSGTSGDQLSYISFEEGRIRVVTPTSQDNGYDQLTVDGNIDLPNGKRGAFDYFILDYQQNVRMLLSEETHVAANTATMESSRAAVEDAIFGQTGSANEVETTRYPASSTGWQHPDIGASVSRLGNTAGYNVGPNTLQKVMAGDLVATNVQYYYDQSTSGNNPDFVSNVLNSLILALTNGPTTSAVKGGATGINSSLNADPGFVSAVQPTTDAGETPLSYLTVLFFDERFNLVSAEDGGVYQQQVSAVGSAGSSLSLTNLKAPKNGYVFIYVSNQSDQPVYFDNLAVSIRQGHIVEENHYYAFGLKIAAISSRKFSDMYDGDTKNSYQLQGAFCEMDDDIGWNDFALRNYDPQVGRWVQVDPFADGFISSPYVGMGNDPMNMVDPSGGEPLPFINILYKGGQLSGEVLPTVVVVGKASGSAISAVSTLQIALKTISILNQVGHAIDVVSRATNTEAVGDFNRDPHKLQTAADGDGPYYKRTYEMKLQFSIRTAKEVYQDVANNFNIFTEGVSYFEKINGKKNVIAVGDEYAIVGGPNYHSGSVSEKKKSLGKSADQFLAAQKDFVDEESGTYHGGVIHTGVTITGTCTSDNSYAFTFGTWQGHVEAGTITFTFTQAQDYVLVNITSKTRSSNFFTDIAYRYLGGYELQSKHWETFLTNLAKRNLVNKTEIKETTFRSNEPID